MLIPGEPAGKTTEQLRIHAEEIAIIIAKIMEGLGVTIFLTTNDPRKDARDGSGVIKLCVEEQDNAAVHFDINGKQIQKIKTVALCDIGYGFNDVATYTKEFLRSGTLTKQINGSNNELSYLSLESIEKEKIYYYFLYNFDPRGGTPANQYFVKRIIKYFKAKHDYETEFNPEWDFSLYAEQLCRSFAEEYRGIDPDTDKFGKEDENVSFITKKLIEDVTETSTRGGRKTRRVKKSTRIISRVIAKKKTKRGNRGRGRTKKRYVKTR